MKKLLLGLALLALIPNVAMAAPFSVHISAEDPGWGVKIYAPGTLANGVSSVAGAATFTGQLGTFESYCIDLNHYIALPGNYLVDNPLSAMADWSLGSSYSSADAGKKAAWLYNTYAGTQNATGRYGLQLAIWNALYDTDALVRAGSGFWVTNYNAGGADAADIMLAALYATDYTQANASWLRIPDNAAGTYTQDFIGPQVPEPGSMLLLGSGLFGLAAAVRRRLKK